MAPVASHLASLGIDTLQLGLNKFKVTTQELPLNIIQFEYQLNDIDDNYTGGYIYMSQVSFVKNDSGNYEYSVPVPAEEEPINSNKTIRFRYWDLDLNTPPSEWSNELGFYNPPAKPVLENSFVLFRRADPDANDDKLFFELSDVSVAAYLDPNGTSSTLSSGPIKFLVVYGYKDSDGADIWKTSGLVQPEDNGTFTVDLGNDVFADTSVSSSVFAVYEYVEDGTFYTISQISDASPSTNPNSEDLKAVVVEFEYVVNVLSTTPTSFTSTQTSSLYDVGNSNIQLTWAPPKTHKLTEVVGYEVQVRVATETNSNSFVKLVDTDADQRGLLFPVTDVTTLLGPTGVTQLSSTAIPALGTELEFRVVSVDSKNNESNNVSIKVGELSPELSSDDVRPAGHFAEISSDNLSFTAVYNIAALKDSVTPSMGALKTIETRVLRVVDGVSTIVKSGSIPIESSKSVYNQREVYPLLEGLTHLDNTTNSTFVLVVWVVNDILEHIDGKNVYLDASLSDAAILENNNSSGWNVSEDIDVPVTSRGFIFNLAIDTTKNTFGFMAVTKLPINNFDSIAQVLSLGDTFPSLFFGKTVQSDQYTFETVTSTNFSAANLPDVVKDELEFPYIENQVFINTITSISFKDVFDIDVSPQTFLVKFTDSMSTSAIINNEVFAGLTLTQEEITSWKGP